MTYLILGNDTMICYHVLDSWDKIRIIIHEPEHWTVWHFWDTLWEFDIAMEHHHFQWVNPLYMAIFHSYVKLPEGNLTFTIHVLRYGDPRSFLSRKELHPHYNTSIFHDYPRYIPSISIIILHYIQLDPAIIGWYPASYHTFFLVQSPSISRYSFF